MSCITLAACSFFVGAMAELDCCSSDYESSDSDESLYEQVVEEEGNETILVSRQDVRNA